MNDLMEKITDQLKNVTKTVFMGLGEEKLSDDGVGPYIISELLSYSNDKIRFINAGIDPMSRIDDVVNFNPSHLVIIDTCTLNDVPGTIAILNRDNICDYVPISTHTIPIHIVIDLIIAQLPKLKIFMIGIVPESLDGFTELKLYKKDEITLEERAQNEDIPFFDFHLSITIKAVADKLIQLIKTIIKGL